MIKLKNLNFSYGSSTKTKQLKNISLNIRPGEFILLTGKSGCGKTTLTRVLNGLCPQFYPGELTGEYFLDGRSVKEIPINEIGTIVGSVFQDPRSQFFTSNTTDEIVMGMENNAFPREEMEDRFLQTISQIGVEPLLGKSIFPLSSGEKQKIAIASVYTMLPKVLVLDEPSANLDSDTITHLKALLTKLKKAGTTIILSEHRLHYAKDLFDKMVYMQKGEIIKEYPRDEAFALTDDELKDRGLRLFSEPEINVDKRILYNEEDFFCAKGLSIALSGQKVLDEVEFSTATGKIMAVLGGNGAGKTTLCRVLTGLHKQNVGQIFIDGRETKSNQRVWKTFFVQQDSDYQLYAPTVEDEFFIGNGKKKATKERIYEILAEVGLDGMEDRHPLSLSGGEKQRLLLALAVAYEKDILILDEPTSGLDGANMRLTAQFIKKLAEQGKCIILITHDRELINLVADSLLYLDKGRAVYHRSLLK